MAVISTLDNIMFNSKQVVLIVPADDAWRRSGCRSEVQFTDGRKLHLRDDPAQLQRLINQAEQE